MASRDHVSHETIIGVAPPEGTPVTVIDRADLMSVSLLPGGQIGIAYTVREQHTEPDPASQPPQEQPAPERRQTPTRPEDDQRRTHRPTSPRQGEQQRPAPNRQVRPK